MVSLMVCQATNHRLRPRKFNRSWNKTSNPSSIISTILFLSSGTKILFVLFSLSALPDMFLLTYFGVTNLAEFFVRIYYGRKVRIAEAKSFDGPFKLGLLNWMNGKTALDLLPRVLNHNHP